MSLTVNGRSITIAEYVTLIIDAARKIIEKEQSEISASKTMNDSVNTELDESGVSVESINFKKDAEQTPVQNGDIHAGISSDSGSVLLRLPDGSLQTVEEYILGIIKDASSHIDSERPNGSVVMSNPEKEIQDGETQSSINEPTEEREKEMAVLKSECTRPQQQQDKPKSATVKRSNSVQKVFNRIFGRGKSKSKNTVNDMEECDKRTSWQASDRESPKVTTEGSSDHQVVGDDVIQKIDNPNSESKATNATAGSHRKEIPEKKHKIKKRNSFRNMLSCFSSKSAQAD